MGQGPQAGAAIRDRCADETAIDERVFARRFGRHPQWYDAQLWLSQQVSHLAALGYGAAARLASTLGGRAAARQFFLQAVDHRPSLAFDPWPSHIPILRGRDGATRLRAWLAENEADVPAAPYPMAAAEQAHPRGWT